MTTRPTAVCIIVENLPVPLDRRVWREACALRAAGYRVSVIFPKGKGWTAGYETIEGIEVYRHKAWEASGIAGYLLEYTAALACELFLTLKVSGAPGSVFCKRAILRIPFFSSRCC